MTRAHLTTRIVTAATAPLVRNVGPRLAEGFKHFLQLIGFGLLACFLAAVAEIVHTNGIPWGVIKAVAALSILLPILFGILTVLEQIRLNYDRQDPSVYEPVEPFEQRRPVITDE